MLMTFFVVVKSTKVVFTYMSEKKPLELIIEAAKSGDSSALSELSIIALGGNETAQQAIREIDAGEWTAVEAAIVHTMTWPGQNKEGWEGPKKGDVPSHPDV